MISAGNNFAAPRKGDTRSWAAVAAVLEAGLTYDGFETCGCGRQPNPRPRTGAQVRARLRAGTRAGLTEPKALTLRDPADAHR
ncbi:hypothetical protein [Rhizohabitans arisaemae]|uniref:hypothetical protein n=1 Tax=Rhizohabitans arisaemae TaxID=2720610 RepID=UPI0024B17D6D|nr:hypothetical protein [Rhizohabitans arisaemae]